MIKIGSRVLLASHSLLIPAKERAAIDMDVFGWKFQLGIVFEDAHSEQGIEVKPTASGVDLLFKNWANSLGTALTEPGSLATLSLGGKLEFMASNYRIGETNQFEIQFLHNQEAK